MPLRQKAEGLRYRYSVGEAGFRLEHCFQNTYTSNMYEDHFFFNFSKLIRLITEE